MKPIWNAPAMGTVHAGPSRLLVVLLMLVPWVLLLPMFLLSPYLVTLRSAWSQQPARWWRTAVVASVALAVVTAVALSPIVVPSGAPLALPADDRIYGPVMPGLATCVIAINAFLAAGAALLPLACASSVATLRNRGAWPPAASRARGAS